MPYIYDANGNLLTDGVNSYTYDYANRMTGLNDGTTNYAYAYNGRGDRLQQTVDGVTTTYNLDLNTGLTRILEDGSAMYLYGYVRVSLTPSAVCTAGDGSAASPASEGGDWAARELGPIHLLEVAEQLAFP